MTERTERVSFRSPGRAWDLAGILHLPADLDENGSCPAIVSVHPIGSCKEQTAGNVYAKALAESGCVVLVFDASCQGDSGGQPRLIEDPALRVEDVRVAVDHLVTLPYVDADRIGGIGVCGGGGYVIKRRGGHLARRPLRPAGPDAPGHRSRDGILRHPPLSPARPETPMRTSTRGKS
ncbi:alpha/beta hydrolase [Streptomyces zhihengii]